MFSLCGWSSQDLVGEIKVFFFGGGVLPFDFIREKTTTAK